MYGEALRAKEQLDAAYKDAQATDDGDPNTPPDPATDANLRALADRAHRLATDAAGAGTDYLMLLRNQYSGNRFASAEIDNMMGQSLSRQKVAAQNAATEAHRYSAEMAIVQEGVRGEFDNQGRRITGASNERVQGSEAEVARERMDTDLEIERLRNLRQKGKNETDITINRGGGSNAQSLKLRAETLAEVRDEVDAAWGDMTKEEKAAIGDEATWKREAFVQESNQRLSDIGLPPELAQVTKEEVEAPPEPEPSESDATQLEIQSLREDIDNAKAIRAAIERAPENPRIGKMKTGGLGAIEGARVPETFSSKDQSRVDKLDALVAQLEAKIEEMTGQRQEQVSEERGSDVDQALNDLLQKHSGAPKAAEAQAPSQEVTEEQLDVPFSQAAKDPNNQIDAKTLAKMKAIAAKLKKQNKMEPSLGQVLDALSE